MTPGTSPDPYYSLIAAVHGITGAVIFVTGLLQFLLRKGGRMHRIIGNIYLYSWLVILVTGSYIGSMMVVAIVGLGFYLCLTGVRLAVLRGKPFTKVDIYITLIALLVVVFLAVTAVVLAARRETTAAILATVFAVLYGWLVGNDALQIFTGKRLFAKPIYGKMGWYLGHMTKMGASYITAVSAFTAVQNVFGNTLANFLLPGVIGTVILVMSRKYVIRKLNLVPEK